jgi:hypothetical protein
MRIASFALPVWLWVSFPGGLLPRHLEPIRRALRRHARPPRFHIFELNESTISQFLPFHTPLRAVHAVAAMSPAAMSDLARTALLAQYGGVWLDTDLLLTSDLQQIVYPALETNDTVSYAAHAGQASRGLFSQASSLRVGGASHCGCYHGRSSASDSPPHALALPEVQSAATT